MKITQVVALMIGVAYSLTSASTSFINMLTSSGSGMPPGFGPEGGQVTPIIYWVVGLLFLCLAGALNRIHQPIATAIGIPGILLMTTGGFGSLLFMFPSQMIPIVLNLLSTLVYLAGIFLIYRLDDQMKVKPIYQTKPVPQTVEAAPVMPASQPNTDQRG